MSVPVESLLERFVEPEPMSGCWIWVGHRTTAGYGACMREQKKLAAHRVMYEHFCGPIPSGLEIDHLCRNRACVNPNHLEIVTRRINVIRGLSPAAFHAAQTHCVHGHAFTPETTYFQDTASARQRVCKVCRRAIDARRRMAKRSA